MTALLVSLVFVAVAAIVAVVAHRRKRLPIASMAIAFAVLAVLTVVFDSVMIAAGLFDYGDEHLLGVRIGLAPIEDLAYPLAAALLLPALWQLLGGADDR